MVKFQALNKLSYIMEPVAAKRLVLCIMVIMLALEEHMFMLSTLVLGTQATILVAEPLLEHFKPLYLILVRVVLFKLISSPGRLDLSCLFF